MADVTIYVESVALPNFAVIDPASGMSNAVEVIRGGRRFYCCSESLTKAWLELPFSTPPVKADGLPEVLRRCRRRRSEHGGHALEHLRALLLAHLRRLVAHQFGRYPAAGGGHLSLLIVASELQRDGDPALGG